MNSNKIKTGLASYGMSGRVFHAPFIDTHPQFELTAITERSKNLSREQYPNVHIVRSFDELVAMDEIELVIVNTPDATHYEYTKKALEAGKNVITEKPFTQTTEEGGELISLAKEKGLMLGVYQNRRWDADFLTVKEIIDHQKIGRIVEFESTFSRYRNYIQAGNWKEQDGGMTYNLGSHLIDQCVCLFGLPEAVFADIAVLRNGGIVDDYFMIHLLRCAKAPDVRITLKAGYLMCEPEPRFVVHGTLGSYVKYGVDKQEELLKNGAVPDTPDWGVETENEWGILKMETNGRAFHEKYPSRRGNYADFYESVYRHLRNGIPLPTDAAGVLPIITVIEAAKESSRDRKIVTINRLQE
ncbi:MAG: Gfo/Idh/MocA family oxidoreductase [Tannerella sp.]|jgi:predicted dehydrogenase|nr:Gfo/Idh/MocA family oxidoreductase [Tannerella sp.]